MIDQIHQVHPVSPTDAVNKNQALSLSHLEISVTDFIFKLNRLRGRGNFDDFGLQLFRPNGQFFTQQLFLNYRFYIGFLTDVLQRVLDSKPSYFNLST